MDNNQEKSALFLQKWWWDITARDQWKYINTAGVLASELRWPIYELRLGGFKLATLPVLTMYSGPIGAELMDDSDLQKCLSPLLDKFETYPSFKQFLYPHFPLVQLFRDRGYVVTRRRTYQIDTRPPEDEIFAGIKKKRRNCVRRGLRGYTIKDNQHIDDQIKIVFSTLKRKGVKPSYNQTLLKKLIGAAIERDQGRIMTAITEDGAVAASIFLVWDETAMYYLLGGYTELDTSSFATSSLLWNAILLAKAKGLIFDFEGSMVETIASYFRSFGAVEVPYYKVEKINSPILRILKRIKQKYEKN